MNSFREKIDSKITEKFNYFPIFSISLRYILSEFAEIRISKTDMPSDIIRNISAIPKTYTEIVCKPI